MWLTTFLYSLILAYKGAFYGLLQFILLIFFIAFLGLSVLFPFTGILNSRLAIKLFFTLTHMHVLCSATVLISNCIYNFNLIISHARLIKISAARVAGANAELHSRLKSSSPVASRQSPVLSDPSSFSVPHYYYPRFAARSRSHSHSRPARVGVWSGWGLVVLVASAAYWTIATAARYNSFAKRIQKCWWDYYTLFSNVELQVESQHTCTCPSCRLCESVCVCVGLYLFNVEDCIVFCLKH